MRVSVYVKERKNECVRMQMREYVCVCEYVCERERERVESDKICVYANECACMCEREKE